MPARSGYTSPGVYVTEIERVPPWRERGDRWPGLTRNEVEIAEWLVEAIPMVRGNGYDLQDYVLRQFPHLGIMDLHVERRFEFDELLIEIHIQEDGTESRLDFRYRFGELRLNNVDRRRREQYRSHLDYGYSINHPQEVLNYRPPPPIRQAPDRSFRLTIPDAGINERVEVSLPLPTPRPLETAPMPPPDDEADGDEIDSLMTAGINITMPALPAPTQAIDASLEAASLYASLSEMTALLDEVIGEINPHHMLHSELVISMEETRTLLSRLKPKTTDEIRTKSTNPWGGKKRTTAPDTET